MESEVQLAARSEAQNGVVSVMLAGELDMATAPTLSEHLAPFEDEGVAAILLDLRELTFADSTGVLAIIRARDRANTAGQRFVLVGAQRAVRRVFELTGSESHLDDHELSDVVARFSGNQ